MLSHLLSWLALPSVGLGALFVVSALAATILPLGSEPVFVAYLALKPELFWATVWVATVGNSLGGLLTYLMGAGAQQGYRHWRFKHQVVAPAAQVLHPEPAANPVGESGGNASRASLGLAWVQRFGAPILLLSWLPLIGDPLCAMAGWLRLPWRACLFFIVLGKFARYLVLAGLLQLWLD